MESDRIFARKLVCAQWLGILSLGLSCLTSEAAIGSSNWPTTLEAKIPVTIGSQADRGVLKIASNEQNDVFISWFDNISGSYSMKMQRLDADGWLQWTEQGKVISDYPQNTWVSDYDLVTGADRDAFLFFTDVRYDSANTDLNAYRVSKDGEALWGNSGRRLSIGEKRGNYLPRALATRDGNIAITWIDMGDGTGEGDQSRIHIRKLNKSGEDVWSEVITIASDSHDLMYPQLLETSDGSLLLQYIENLGMSGGISRGHIMMQKIGTNGKTVWENDGNAIARNIFWHPGRLPEAISDGRDGVYVLWSGSSEDASVPAYHARVYAQHMSADGHLSWNSTGLEVSSAVGSHASYKPILLPDSHDLFVFFVTDSDHSPYPSTYKIHGQRLNPAGTRAWDAEGRQLTEDSTASISGFQVIKQGNQALLAYIMDDSSIQAFSVSNSGGRSATRTIAQGASIDDLVSMASKNADVVFAWEEKDSENSIKIYAKMLNADGLLGKQD